MGHMAVKPLKSNTQWCLKIMLEKRLSDYRVTLAYFNMVTLPHKMVGLERMSD